jgi:hypothetical protein
MCNVQALRHSKVKLTWDADDPQRSKLTRRDASKLSAAELDNLDASLYLASDSSGDDEGAHSASESDAAPPLSKRDRLRRALGLIDEGDAATLGPKKRGGKREEMQITFAPAFAEAKKADEGETTLNAYQRKERERRARKKAERAAKSAAPAPAAAAAADDFDSEPSEVESLAGFDDGGAAEAPAAIEADGFDDPFFASDSDAEQTAIRAHDDGSAAGAAPMTTDKAERKQSKATRRAAKAAEAETSAQQRAELGLLVDSDSDEGGASRHFDMKAILKAEKEAGRVQKGKRKRKRRGAAGAKEDDGAGAKDGFEVDVGDERFKPLFDDHRYAMDPSNPQCV